MQQWGWEDDDGDGGSGDDGGEGDDGDYEDLLHLLGYIAGAVVQGQAEGWSWVQGCKV